MIIKKPIKMIIKKPIKIGRPILRNSTPSVSVHWRHSLSREGRALTREQSRSVQNQLTNQRCSSLHPVTSPPFSSPEALLRIQWPELGLVGSAKRLLSPTLNRSRLGGLLVAMGSWTSPGISSQFPNSRLTSWAKWKTKERKENILESWMLRNQFFVFQNYVCTLRK